MRQVIEHPVTEDQREEDNEHSPIMESARPDPSEQQTPNHEHHKRVRIGIADEIERRHHGNAGRDTDHLDACRKKHRPQKVGKYRGGEQRGERHTRHPTLGRKAEGEVSDEQAFYFST